MLNPPAGPEGPGHFDPMRVEHLHDVVADGVDDVLVKDALVPEGPQIQLERLGLQDPSVGDVPDVDRGKVRLPGGRAQTGEFIRA